MERLFVLDLILDIALIASKHSIVSVGGGIIGTGCIGRFSIGLQKSISQMIYMSIQFSPCRSGFRTCTMGSKLYIFLSFFDTGLD